MKIGALDVGTNTVLMLVAETTADGGARRVIDLARITRLGQGVDRNHRLDPQAAARTLDAIAAIAEELRDRYGPLPKEAEALLELSRLRLLASAKGVEKLSLEQRRLTLEVGRRFSLSESALPALTSLTRGNFRFTQGSIVAHLPPHDDAGDGKLATVREIIAAL